MPTQNDGTHADNFEHLTLMTPIENLSEKELARRQEMLNRHRAAGQAPMQYSSTGAARDNKGKPPLHLVPYEAVEAIAMVLFKSSIPGGGKYPTHNWKKGDKHSTPLDSLLRHAMRLANGELIDPESGLPHSWHIICNAAFIVYYQKHFPNYDDLSAPTEVPPMPNPAQVQEPSSEATPVPAKGTPGIPLSALLPMLGALMISQSPAQEVKNDTK